MRVRSGEIQAGVVSHHGLICRCDISGHGAPWEPIPRVLCGVARGRFAEGCTTNRPTGRAFLLTAAHTGLAELELKRNVLVVAGNVRSLGELPERQNDLAGGALQHHCERGVRSEPRRGE